MSRFIESKCDRCGKATKPKQNNTGDLFCVTDEAGNIPAGLESFAICAKCSEKYTAIEILKWNSEKEAIS